MINIKNIFRFCFIQLPVKECAMFYLIFLANVQKLSDTVCTIA